MNQEHKICAVKRNNFSSKAVRSQNIFNILIGKTPSPEKLQPNCCIITKYHLASCSKSDYQKF
jgi:hypothetical protein